MNNQVVILVAEDDEGHFALVKKNLQRAGITNEAIRFADGQDILDYLLMRGDGPKRQPGKAGLLLLDIRMPKVDGLEVLRTIKADPELKKMPVIMLTTTDDPKEIKKCHEDGCGAYIIKPVDYESFVDVIRTTGGFLSKVKLPILAGSGREGVAAQ